MHYNKLKISLDATSKLRSLRTRGGLTPNLLCRYALMSSLEEGPIGNAPPPDQDGLEFNAYTLTGDLTGIYLGLVRFVEQEAPGANELSEEELMTRFRSHIHRGVAFLAIRSKSMADVVRGVQLSGA